MTILKPKVVIFTTRWIVETHNGSFWEPWGKTGSVYRFHSLDSAKEEYGQYRGEFHYCPTPFRYCEIKIKPEIILNHNVIETDMNGYNESYFLEEE